WQTPYFSIYASIPFRVFLFHKPSIPSKSSNLLVSSKKKKKKRKKTRYLHPDRFTRYRDRKIPFNSSQSTEFITIIVQGVISQRGTNYPVTQNK
ncbi:unnamed protein product, partial [Heterotrigona itama]